MKKRDVYREHICECIAEDKGGDKEEGKNKVGQFVLEPEHVSIITTNQKIMIMILQPLVYNDQNNTRCKLYNLNLGDRLIWSVWRFKITLNRANENNLVSFPNVRMSIPFTLSQP